MSQFEKYPHIENLYKKADQLVGKTVSIQEKLHGTNFRFQLLHSAEHLVREAQGDWGKERVKFGSKNIELDIQKEIEGPSEFYSGRPVRDTLKFIQTHQNELDSVWFWLNLSWSEPITFYGEWIGKGCLTEIVYEGEPSFHCFMIKVKGEILCRSQIETICKIAGFNYVHEFARGKFTIEELMEFKNLPSKVNGKKIEGVVIITDPVELDHRGDILMAKDKNPDFAEEKPAKVHDPEEKVRKSLSMEFAHRFVTPGRIHNVLSHGDFVPQNDIKDMKHLSVLIPDDIRRECEGEWNSLIEKGVTERQIRTSIVNHTAHTYKEMLLKQTMENVVNV